MACVSSSTFLYSTLLLIVSQSVLAAHINKTVYVYDPPDSLEYGGKSFPVYNGSLPEYVSKYRSSENKYRLLLSGLALYNLGKVSENEELKKFNDTYEPRDSDVCLFTAQDQSGNADKMRIECNMITYVYWESERSYQEDLKKSNSTEDLNTSQKVPSIDTTTLRSTTDPSFNGEPVISQDYNCALARYTHYGVTQQTVPCQLLETYSKKSLKNNSFRLSSSLFVVLSLVTLLSLY